MNDDLRTIVAARQPVWQLRAEAARCGMRSLAHAGEELVARGITTPDELFRVARGAKQREH
jgi:type II secretory ATPase GspE/PulE/Tfp pilus assembly ATPase PilB-like protein